MTADLTERLQAGLGDAYALEREFRSGGMARVFLAEDKTLGRKVVVKVLPPELASEISTDRFTREIKVSARLQHPQIVPLLSAGDAAGLPYYTMPYVEGEGLRDRLEREGRLGINASLCILRDVAKALAFAHGKGVVHRDIKPDNVLLVGDSAVVADFGIAKAIGVARDTRDEANRSAALTSIGTALGSPAYMAPEQAAGDPATDHRADIYSFGCLAYEILTGQPPFSGRTLHQLFAAHMSETPGPVGERRQDCPRPLATLVTRCLEKDPANRPQAATELVRALDTAGYPSGSRRTAWLRRWPVAAAVVVAMLAAIVAVARLWPRGMSSTAIAVLPFRSLDADSADAYFAQGIAEELALSLQKLPGLRVVAQSSAAAVVDRGLTVTQIGHTLDVGSVLEGTVRRAAGRLRLTATLSDATDGKVVWSDALDRSAGDFFAMQDDLARSIVRALQVRLTDAARPSVVRGTSNPRAYDYYLRGRFTITQGYRDRRALPSAVAFFERAIAEDSGFARAYSGYADAMSLLPPFNQTPTDSVLPYVLAAANRAIALNGSLGEAHASLARAYSYDLRWADADREYRRAIDLDPNYATAHTWYGSLLCGMGRIVECVEHAQRSVELDPLNVAFSQQLAHSLMLAGRLPEAEARLRRAIELDSTIIGSATFRLTLLELGKYHELITAYRDGGDLSGHLVYAMTRVGMRAAADSLLHELERRRRSPDPGIRSSEQDLLVAYLALGDTARALGILDRVNVRTARPLGRSPAAPIYDPLRRSARFAGYIRRLGLDPAVVASPKGGRP